MEKKSILILLLILVSIPIAVSIPQFLLFQGTATLDGRIASEETINFSIEGTPIKSTTTDTNGEYGPVLIQGFEDLYEKPIDITIKGYPANQKINYIYPQNIYLNLSTLTEKALRITNSFPDEKEVKVSRTGIQSFSISTSTGYADPVNYSVFVDGELVSNEDSYDYSINNSDSGTHEIKISATDGFLTVSEEWELIIERPETDNFDGETTDFDSLGLDELEDVPNVILEKTGKGKIEFLKDLNLTGVTDLNDKVRIEKGIVAIDSSVYPQLNKPARITLTGLKYSTIPNIFYDNGFTTNPFSINKECDFCNIIDYTPNPATKGVVVFEVEHFSSFKAGESGNRYNLSLFNDLDTCEAGTVGDLDLKLKDPDEGNEFGPGEEIKIKLDVKNNADENKRIVVEAFLYNIDEDDIEAEVDDEKKIKDGKDETFEFTPEAPTDFENGDYLIFVKAYEDRNEGGQCVEGAIGINLEREKYEIIIKEFSINPESVSAGKSFDVFVEVHNVGKSDEDVYMLAEIKELGVSTESGIFELEEFGEDDTHSETLSLKIPADSEKRDYNVIIRAVFSDDDYEKTATISVLDAAPIIKEPIDLTFQKIEKVEEKSPIQKAPEIPRKSFEIPPEVPILLVLGIGILILLIAIVSVVKKRAEKNLFLIKL